MLKQSQLDWLRGYATRESASWWTFEGAFDCFRREYSERLKRRESFFFLYKVWDWSFLLEQFVLNLFLFPSFFMMNWVSWRVFPDFGHRSFLRVSFYLFAFVSKTLEGIEVGFWDFICSTHFLNSKINIGIRFINIYFVQKNILL